ncbi:MAG TPA: hypothetical protein VM243_10565 [Phycisphaerae bacterium]|nr:hypothetical protein [Phycisphaerae bacterium]
MGKKWIKWGAMIAASGFLFHGTACLNIGGLGKLASGLAYDMVTDAAYEFVFDNDAVFDLFQDDFGTGTQYDDRFTDPSRAEPEGFAAAELGTGG